MFNQLICLVFISILTNLYTRAQSNEIPQLELSGQGMLVLGRYVGPIVLIYYFDLKNYSDFSELILCRKCGADIADTNYIFSKQSPGATMTENRKLFGKQNLTVQTLINPYGIQFEIITLEKARCENIGHVSYSLNAHFLNIINYRTHA